MSSLCIACACRILADEEAKEARIRKEHENRELAMSMKVAAARADGERQQAEEQRQAEHRALVADVQSQRDRPMIARRDVERKNKTGARELRQEIQQMEAQLQAERRAEDARRADLIKQIRALELVPRKRETRLDPTYTPQLGLLEEMSLAELRERLLIVEEQRSEEEEQKRAKIKTTKQERDVDLAQRAQRLTEMRERAALEAAAKREQSKTAQRVAEGERKERIADAQLKVQETLEAKRAARLQKEQELATELKRIRIKNQFLEADKEVRSRSSRGISPLRLTAYLLCIHGCFMCVCAAGGRAQEVGVTAAGRAA